ncbi:hypothetical protein GCM10007108_03180 [Thermogymnomonas acidicola]|uniref:Uncharacterized protein n=1 Tax=Thermogymnomonas acidicola TaxID=399579 RepID=A0AA37BQC3_9ARCH|nr:helix-turn-helix domain-containing protein [Thermogymnomonas acidicola]GGM68437.1 hypothetical protein GCM10007108_03180 [Thermogymnomonas acidicola]
MGIPEISDREWIYIRTMAMFRKLGVQETLENIRKAMKFYWGKDYRVRSEASLVRKVPNFNDLLEREMQTLSEEELQRMREALSDSYLTISRAADVCDIDRSMLRRLVDEGTIPHIEVENPYYSRAAPMRLVRLSSVRKWMEENPKAVEISRKIAHAAKKARDTRKRREEEKRQETIQRLQELLVRVKEIAKSDPVPLLAFWLKILELFRVDKKSVASLFQEAIYQATAYESVDRVTLSHIMEVYDDTHPVLCKDCFNNAKSLGMSSSEYARKIGTCENCKEVTEVISLGHYDEVTFHSPVYDFSFVIDHGLVRRIISARPDIEVAERIRVFSDSGSFLDELPVEIVPYSISEIIANIKGCLSAIRSGSTGV